MIKRKKRKVTRRVCIGLWCGDWYVFPADGGEPEQGFGTLALAREWCEGIGYMVVDVWLDDPFAGVGD